VLSLHVSNHRAFAQRARLHVVGWLAALCRTLTPAVCNPPKRCAPYCRGFLSDEAYVNAIDEIAALPEKITSIVGSCGAILDLSRAFRFSSSFLFLGRGYNFPVALEGALKLKVRCGAGGDGRGGRTHTHTHTRARARTHVLTLRTGLLSRRGHTWCGVPRN
jgi:hypothetical protein